MTLAEDYTELQAMAVELIAEAGRSVTITKNDRTPADSNKPWRESGVTTATWTCQAVFVELSSAVKLGMMLKTQDMEKRGGRCLLVGASPGCPDLLSYDTVTDGSEVLRIEQAQVLKPGGTVLAYFFEVVS